MTKDTTATPAGRERADSEPLARLLPTSPPMKPEIHPEIHGMIDAEFARAYAKHAGKTPRSWHVGDATSLVVLVEEVGEVARAMTYDEGNQDNLAAELIQVATMAAAWAERLLIRGDQ